MSWRALFRWSTVAAGGLETHRSKDCCKQATNPDNMEQPARSAALAKFKKSLKEDRSGLVERYLDMWEEAVEGGVNDLWLYPPAGELYTASAGLREMHKNRYWNRLPYDRNRVLVEESPDGDYINATHMSTAPQCSASVAAQGPLESTVHNFWRMLVQCDIDLVLMLTERNCHMYWPLLVDGVARFAGRIDVRMASEERASAAGGGGHTVRKWLVTVDGKQRRREIVQVQFHGWPDFGAPDDANLLVSYYALVGRVTAALGTQLGRPPNRLVHCTGGNGRTGTFLLLELLIDSYQRGDTAWTDPNGVIQRLRHDRMAMVETEEQMLYACDAFVAYLGAL